jgi:YbbR domain-containing protein
MYKSKKSGKKTTISRSLELIIPFLLASLLWLVIVGNGEYSIVIETPIEVYDPRPEKVLNNKIAKHALVRFKGRGTSLFLARYFEPPKLILDISTIQRHFQINLKEYYEKYPHRILFSRDLLTFQEIVFPDIIEINLDNKISREIPVKLNQTVQVKPGYLLIGKVAPEPARVTVTGPQSQVNELSIIETEMVRLREIISNIDYEAALQNPQPDFFTLSPQKVRLFGEVQSIGERIIYEIPVEIKNPPAGQTLRVTPEKIAIRVIGANKLINELTPEDIEISIDYASQWIPNKLDYVPSVKVPEAVLEWREMIPNRIEVLIVREE